MPEALVAALDELTVAWREAMADEAFRADFDTILREYAGVPSLLYDAARLTERIGGARILLKREDLNHTGAHKVRNVLGQALLTKRMGKHRVIAETGAGQHGVASATAAAYFGLDCTVYMGSVDVKRQALNVARMELLGAKVIPVDSGSATLKDAINEALRDWVASVDHTAYLFGTAAGPHPFPSMVRDFTRGIGDEARAQCLDQFGRLPDAVAACVGGGSNAIGLFTAFLDDPEVAIYGFEAGGDGIETGRHAATIAAGDSGVLHGARTFVLQDEDGQTIESHSISAGLDYPGVGPQHAHLAKSGRAEYLPITDAQAMDALALLARTEGIIAAIESAHALAGAFDVARQLGPQGLVLVNLSGRGDKDMETTISWFDLRTGGSDSRETGRERSHGLREGPRRRPERPGRLPAGGVPRRRRRHRRTPRDGRLGLRRHRGRPALLRPGHGRAHHPGRRAAGPAGRRPDRRRAAHRRGGRRHRYARRGDDLLEPRRALRRGALRGRSRRRRRRGPDHPRPDARLRPRVVGRGRPARPRQGLPGRAVVDRRADRDDRAGLPRLRLRHCRDGRHRRPHHHERAGRAAGRAHQARLSRTCRATCPSAVGLGVSNGDQAAEVASYADGVIVGSAFVRTLLDHPDDRAEGLRALAVLTADLAEGVRRA